MDDISDVSRVEIPPTMILGSARPQITHLSTLSISASQDTVYAYAVLRQWRVRACCILHPGARAVLQDVWRVPHPTSHTLDVPFPGPGILDHSVSQDLRSNTLYLMIPGS